MKIAPNKLTIGTAFLQGLTLGMLNFSTGKLIIKDPITGLCNTVKQTKDAIMNDFSKGVWIGKRCCQGSIWGYSSFLTQNFNLNYLHYVIRIDGQNWHLCQVSGSTCLGIKSSGDSKIYVGRCYEQNSKFEWFYKGQANRRIKTAVDFINSKCEQYNVILKNCQDVVKALYYYSRFPGAGYAEIILFLFPKQVSDKILATMITILPGTKVLAELMNMVLP